MKLTKLQRHTAYIILLAEAEERYRDGLFNGGLCYVWEAITDEWPCHGMQHGFVDLPELWNKRTTEDVFAAWFPESKGGWQKRIKILKQCIEETA